MRQDEARNHSNGKQEVEHGAEDKARSLENLSTEKDSETVRNLYYLHDL